MTFKIKYKFYDSREDQDCLLQINLFFYELKLFLWSTAGYAGWIDSNDHSKGINEWTRGCELRLMISDNRHKIVYPEDN